MELLKVARWGNSLAVRLPSKMVKELGIKEGDFLSRDFLALHRSTHRKSKEEALESIRQLRSKFPKDLKPEDWKIDHNDPDMRG
jgi:antitoxin MazE